MSCCHEKEAKDLRRRVQELTDEISDLTAEAACQVDYLYDVRRLEEEQGDLTEAVEDFARGIVNVDELLEIARKGRR